MGAARKRASGPSPFSTQRTQSRNPIRCISRVTVLSDNAHSIATQFDVFPELLYFQNNAKSLTTQFDVFPELLYTQNNAHSLTTQFKVFTELFMKYVSTPVPYTRNVGGAHLLAGATNTLAQSAPEAEKWNTLRPVVQPQTLKHIPRTLNDKSHPSNPLL
jgi:hypothetical protein